MKQTRQNSTHRKEKSKNSTPVAGDELIYAFDNIPVTPSIVEKWAEELEKWAKVNTAEKTITQWIRLKGISRSNFYSLVKKHKCLALAHENVMREIGERLWSKAVDRQADWKATHFMLHNYAPEFDESNKYHNMLKEAISAVQGLKVVELEKFADSDLVPKKDKK